MNPKDDMPLDELEVSVAASLLLEKLGVKTLGDLLGLETIRASSLVAGELSLLFQELDVTFRGTFDIVAHEIPEGRRVRRIEVRYEEGGDGEAVSRFGGVPSGWASQEPWPACARCRRPLRFVGQIVGPMEIEGAALGEREAVQLFACLHDDSRCSSWIWDAGASHAAVRQILDSTCAEAAAAPFPSHRMILSGGWDDAILRSDEAEDDDPAVWWEAFGDAQRDKLGGIPAAGNDPRPPVCPSCAVAMVFLAQLGGEQVPSPFADGTCFVHLCAGKHAAAIQFVR